MGQISAKYFFKLYRQKIFAVSFKSYIQNWTEENLQIFLSEISEI